VPKEKQFLDVEGRKVAVSNLDKVLYPGAQFTKGQVIDYYIRVAEYLLPHLKDRPVTLKRFPDGVKGEFFYEKDAPKFTPEWVRTVPVPRRAGGKPIEYIVIDDLPTVVWLGNLAALELHPFLHSASDLNKPQSIVFDLDPGDGNNVLDCARVAALLRDLLGGLQLRSFAKVSGSKGLQLYVPLNSPVTYAAIQEFARGVAKFMEARHPAMVVSEMAKNLRTGKVFIDWSQNSDFKTTISVYSLRAKTDRPYVSLAVTWEELADAVKPRPSASTVPTRRLDGVIGAGARDSVPPQRLFQQARFHSYARTRPDSPTPQPPGQPAPVRRPETCSQPPSLRLPAGNARRAEIVGRAQGAAVRTGSGAFGDADRGSSDGLPRVRGHHP
jgi:bifunctional non-homologous end joining protein LigD